MTIFAGKPPDGENPTEINPPFKFEEQKHTGQAYPPEPPAHPLTDSQILDMLDGTGR